MTKRKSLKGALAEDWLSFLNKQRIQSPSSHAPVTPCANELGRADRQTIAVDVRRSSAHWDVHQFMKTSKRVSTRKSLNKLVERVATSIIGFRYYQGIHEICLVVLEVCNGDAEKAFQILVPLLSIHFDHFIEQDFNLCLVPMLESLHYIIEYFSPDLSVVLDTTGVGCHFAVSWILTWFAHSVHTFADISSIFTFLMHFSDQKDKSMILYLCAAVVILNKRVIMENKSDMCHVFKCVQNAAQTVNMQNAIDLARSMKEALPPEELCHNSTRKGLFNTLNPTVSIIRRYLPAMVGAAVTGISIAVVSARR